jgi:DNA (cytosine-5)-methyltransferase 1
VRDAISNVVAIRVGDGYDGETWTSKPRPYPTIGASPTSGANYNNNAGAAEFFISDQLRLDTSREKAVDGHPVFGCNAVAVDHKPCPTITTNSIDTSYKTERRKFSIEELKRICSFPDDFVLTGSYAQQWERLGRAVPPMMSFAIAESVKSILAKVDKRGAV